MGWVAPVIAGIGALGGLFGNRKQTANSNSNTQSNFGTTSMPALSAEGTGVLYPVADKYLQNLSQDPDLKGYQANQQSDINNMSGIRDKALQFEMNQRGVNPNSPAGMNYFTNSENQRYADTTKLNNSIPLLAQDIMQKKLTQGIDLFRSIPEGTSTSGFSNSGTQGTGTTPGNILGGVFGNLAPLLAYLYGNQQNNGPSRLPTQSAG